MDIKSALYTYLQTKTLITALIGDRLYVENAPQGVAHPYVTYEVTDSVPTAHLGGASAYADDQFSFSIHADMPEDRDAVKEALRNILHTRRNVQLTDAGSVTINIRSITLTHVKDSHQQPVDGSETNGLYECEMDFTIIYYETVPTLP